MANTRSWKDTLGKRDFSERIDRSSGARSVGEARLARLLVAISVIAILFCGLFPFDLSFRNAASQISRRFDWTFTQYFTSGDTPENILFFTPLGFALGALLLRQRGLQIIAGIATVLIGAALSIGIEVLQCLLGDRDPSVTDIANNTIGALVGFAAYRFIGRQVLDAAARWFEQVIGPFTIGTITGIFVLAVCLTPLIIGAHAGSLGTWVPTYSMAVGNEIGASRHWLGWVSDITVAARAANEGELNSIFAKEDPSGIFGDALIAHYDLRGTPPFVDRTGHLPALDLPARIATQPSRLSRRPSTGPIFPVSATAPTERRAIATTTATRPIDPNAAPWELSQDTWLRTAVPVDEITRQLVSSGQFTIALTAASARSDQYQAARLITISAGQDHRNFTIGQDGPNLIVRVRTDATRENGNSPEFVLPDVFFDESPRRIVVTYADSLVRVFVDGLDWRGQARLTPEAAVIWSMYPREYWKSQMDYGDTSRLALIYRAITFLALGALAAATVNLLHRRRHERLTIAVAILAATIILMEALITTLGEQSFAISHVIVSAVAAIIGAMIVKIRADTPWVRTR